MYYGSHVSKHKRGWMASLQEIKSKGGNAAQIFLSSPIGRMSVSSAAEIRAQAGAIKTFLRDNDMRLFVHSAYTLNFSKDPTKEHPYWIDAMIQELKLADMIGAEGCVLHLGKAVSCTHTEAENNMYDNVCRVLDAIMPECASVKLFLETSSGQGTEILPTLNNDLTALATFFKRFDDKYHTHLSLCVDTCHIFAAGYDIGSRVAAGKFFEDWTKHIGMKHMGLVHFNNSVHILGSRKDRHACIEHGQIHLDGLASFGELAVQHGVPLVLETPSGPDEIHIVARLVASKN